MVHAVVSALLGRAAPAPLLPIDDAIAGGAAAPDVAGAFLSGYVAALRALVPGLPRERRICLCATEAGGVHPKNIATAISEGGARLDGRKTWVTGAPLADLLMVLASEGTTPEGRKRLRLVRVEARQAGVALHPMPPTAFVPSIPHAEVSFENVRLQEGALLPGDGWNDYVKPFRTVEDAHVFASVIAYVARVAQRSGWPREHKERLAAVLVTLRAIAAEDPRAPETHVALAGALALGRRALEESAGSWSLVGAEERASWERDRVLLAVAGRARAARAEAAWHSLG